MSDAKQIANRIRGGRVVSIPAVEFAELARELNGEQLLVKIAGHLLKIELVSE